MITKQFPWSALVSAAVSALAITSIVGIVVAADADATKERGPAYDRAPVEQPDRSVPETDSSKIDELRVRVQLQTDRAMEQSSRALRESTKERAKDD